MEVTEISALRHENSGLGILGEKTRGEEKAKAPMTRTAKGAFGGGTVAVCIYFSLPNWSTT